MRKLVLATALVALMTAAWHVALAAPGGAMAACKPDIQKLCQNMASADQHKCLMANTDKVSQDCGTAIANARSESKVFRQACGADIKQYCGGIAPGPERRSCIVSNRAKFSPACQNAMTTR